eukprot:gene995-9901_t
MEEKAVEWKNKGNEEFSKQNYPKAIEIQKSPVFYNNRATAYFKNGNLIKSEEDSNECLKQDDKFWKAYYRLGVIYQQKHNLSKALEIAQKGFQKTKESTLDKLTCDIEKEIRKIQRLSLDKENDRKLLVEYAKNGVIEVFLRFLSYPTTDERSYQLYSNGLVKYAMENLKDETKPIGFQINLLAFLTQVTYPDCPQSRIQGFHPIILNSLISRCKKYNEVNYTCSCLSFFYNILDEESNVPKLGKTQIFEFVSNLLIENNKKEIKEIAIQVIYIISFVIPEGRKYIHNIDKRVVKVMLKNLIENKTNVTWAKTVFHTLTCLVEQKFEYIDMALEMGIIDRCIFELQKGVEKGNAADLINFMCGAESKFAKKIHKKGLIPELCRVLNQTTKSEDSRKILDALFALTYDYYECSKEIILDDGENQFRKLKKSKNNTISNFASLVYDKIQVSVKKIESIKAKCNRPGCEERGDFKKCGKCKNVVYCGENCQKIDWKRHKMECQRAIKNEDTINKKRTEIDRTVAQKWIIEHMFEILTEISKKNLEVYNCVVELDMREINPKLKIWSRKDFENQKVEPYTTLFENMGDSFERKKKMQTSYQFILFTIFTQDLTLSLINFAGNLK